MCVVVASKIKLKNSEKENWFLYKIRDRAYTPEYRIKYNTGKDTGVQAGYIVDNDSDWSEGVNEKGIMIVNAALQNHEDKKDGTSKGKKVSKGKVSRNGVIIREALKQKKIEDAVEILVDARFDGNTLVSDGKRLFVLEIFLHQNTKDKILADLEIDPIADEDDVKAILKKHITPEDYDVKVKEITDKDEKLVVRTNHGILLPKAGYQPKDGVGYDSSTNRRNVVIDTLEKLEPEHPFEILTALKNLGSDDIHKEDIMRPIRTMPASPYLSTTVLMLTGTGSMYILPLDCTFEDTSLNRIQKDRNVHVVILPKKLPLFEDFKEEEIIKTLKEENMLEEADLMIVRDYGRPSPKNKKFKKDYIIIFKNKKHGNYFDAWNYDLGYEANISQEEIDNETKPVSAEEAKMFINYMKNEENLKEEENMKCPKCGSTDIEKSEKSCKCKECGYEGPCAEFEAKEVKEEMSYKEFYAKKLEKFGVKSPEELSDEDSKKFHDEIDSEWEGEKEADEGCDKDKKMDESFATKAVRELANGDKDAFMATVKDALLKEIGSNEKYQEIRSKL